MKKLAGRLVRLFYKKNKKWRDIEYFNPNWKERIKNMSEFIAPGSVIVDLGCGEMWLKDFITKNETYIPVDYTYRGENTIICDFNNYEYPNVEADTAFVSGCFEYVKDYEWFADKISTNHDKCILSYCTIEDFPNISQREAKAWVNHLSEFEIIKLFLDNDFKLVKKMYGYSTFYVFNK